MMKFDPTKIIKQNFQTKKNRDQPFFSKLGAVGHGQAHPSGSSLHNSNKPKSELLSGALGSLNLEKSLKLATKKVREGKRPEAILIYNEILKKFPKNKKVQNALRSLTSGPAQVAKDPPLEQYEPIITLYTQGEFHAALEQAQKILKVFPYSTVLHALCGASYAGLKNFEYSIQSYQSAIKISPSYAEAHFNLANVYYKQEKYEKAISCFNKAIKYKLDYADAYFHLGRAQMESGSFEAAIDSFETLAMLKPDYPAVHFNLGECHRETLDFVTAISYYKKVLKTQPDLAVAHIHLGGCKRSLSDMEGAIEHIKAAIKIKPKSVNAIINLGTLQKDNGNLEDAILTYDSALEILPGNPDALFNQSLAYLAQGNFKKGWPQYEFRWQKHSEEKVGGLNRDAAKTLLKPRWKPGLNGKTLLWSEQGIGDIIMFSSMALELHNASSELIIQTDERLIPLFRRSFPKNIKYFSSNIIIPEAEYDFQIPIGSLPLHFRPNLKSFNKSSQGFLKPDPSLVSELRKKLLGQQHNKIIGITWRGGTKFDSYYKQREIDLASLANILARNDIKLVSLQHGDNKKELDELEKQYGIEVTTVSGLDYFSNLDGLASLICACDQVISADNSVVFLAGALGVHTGVLLPQFPNWRWLRNNDKSYWHAALTLYHKEKPKNDTVKLEKLKLDINRFIGSPD